MLLSCFQWSDIFLWFLINLGLLIFPNLWFVSLFAGLLLGSLFGRVHFFRVGFVIFLACSRLGVNSIIIFGLSILTKKQNSIFVQKRIFSIFGLDIIL